MRAGFYFGLGFLFTAIYAAAIWTGFGHEPDVAAGAFDQAVVVRFQF